MVYIAILTVGINVCKLISSCDPVTVKSVYITSNINFNNFAGNAFRSMVNADI